MDALLVDDSTTMRLRLRRLLEAQRGVSVTDHADTASALVEAQMRAFDLVLVVCRMPALDGIAFIRCMRTIPHYAQVPMVMITDDVSEAVRLAALEAIQAGGIIEFGEREPGVWRVRLAVPLGRP